MIYLIRRTVAFVCLTLLLSSCSAVPNSESYRRLYAHLHSPCTATLQESPESSYFIVFLVDARHLDYTNNQSFFRTVAKHPSDGSKNGDVGHAWVYLQGKVNGQTVFIEGGHTGETGRYQARYFDGIMNYLDYGYSSPNSEQIQSPCYEPNPIKYLWETQHDGFFQWGSGNHVPTFAARIDLSSEQFTRILSFIQNYDYSNYALTGSQCSSFMAQVASLAGMDLECEVTMQVAPHIYIGNRHLRLWEDPAYAYLTIATPDILERSLMAAVNEGNASYAIEWYRRTHKRPWNAHFHEWTNTLILFPKRLSRYHQL